MSEPNEYLRVSYSSLNTAAYCWRKFEFNKLYPQAKRVWDDNYAADVGKALHSGFQEYLISSDKEKAIWALMQEFPYQDEFNQKNDYRNFDAALATLEEMMDSAKMTEYELAHIVRPPSPAEILAGNLTGIAGLGAPKVVPAIEVPFELRFKGVTLPDGRGIAFTGYIDAIMRHYATGLHRTLDIKTSRDSLIDQTGKYKFDSQQVPYGIIVEHMSQQIVEAFEVLYLSCYVDIIEPRVVMYPFMKNQTDIQEWVYNKVLQIKQIQNYMRTNYFPRTEGGCITFNKPCTFLAPCQSRDKDSLIEWFLLGEQPAPTEPFHPWVIADIDVSAVM